MPAKLLIASSEDSNMRYVSGLSMPDPFIYVALEKNEYAIVSKLEYSRAKREAKKNVKVILIDSVEIDNIKKPVDRSRNLADIAAAFLLSYNQTIVKIPENFWAGHMHVLQEHGIRARIQRPFLAQRRVKTQEEIEHIKAAGDVAKKAFEHALGILKEAKIEWNDTLLWKGEKLTSEILRFEIEQKFLANGCQSGETIVSCAEDSAEPHNRGSGVLKAGTPIILDLFPRSQTTGYYFDFTRTVVKGTPGKKLQRMLCAVKIAQEEALKIVAPGSVKHIHEICEEVFTEHGFETTDEEGFIHSTGHGLGLDIHESPSISSMSEDTLESGNVITIEPGLYYKDTGGVRIEDTVLVTEDGYENLTNLPTEYVIE